MLLKGYRRLPRKEMPTLSSRLQKCMLTEGAFRETRPKRPSAFRRPLIWEMPVPRMCSEAWISLAEEFLKGTLGNSDLRK